MREPRISVVIPSRNRIDRLPALVEEYVRQGADEIVVVLDGPHPGWEEELAGLRQHPSVVIDELPSNRGLALARTEGLARSTCAVVLTADDDVFPGPGLVNRHREFHRTHERRALLGYMPVTLPDPRQIDQAATFIYARDYQNQVEQWRVGTSDTLLTSFWGGNASVPREVYLEAEEFKPSERLDYNEDLDLGLRLREIGVAAHFDEFARGAHLHSRSLDAFVRECVVRGRAVRALEQRWPELPLQLTDLVVVPPDHPRVVAALQERIGARDSPGITEAVLRAAYFVVGAVHAWSIQDAIARLLRRGLAIRGYRLACDGERNEG